MKIRAIPSLLLMLFILAGCATTPKIDWNSRIGTYTFDDAVVELGPPDKTADLTDGTRVAEWMVRRGYSRGGTAFGFGGYYGHPFHYGGPVWFHDDPPSPDVFLRLVFNPEGTLQDWKRYYR